MNSKLNFNEDFAVGVCDVSSSQACITFDPPDYVTRQHIEKFQVSQDLFSRIKSLLYGLKDLPERWRISNR
jgi:hypothetical protein